MPASVRFHPAQRAKSYFLGSAAFLMQCVRTNAQSEDNFTGNVTTNTTDVDNNEGINPGVYFLGSMILIAACLLVILKCAHSSSSRSENNDSCCACIGACCCGVATAEYARLN